MTGLMLAVFLSLVMLLYRASRPYIAIVGRSPNGEYNDLGRHPDAQSIPGLVILRLDAPLYFFNANVARAQIAVEITQHIRGADVQIGAGAQIEQNGARLRITHRP